VSQQRAKPGIPSDDGPPLFVAFDPKTSSGVKRTSASKREFPAEIIVFTFLAVILYWTFHRENDHFDLYEKTA
jgi:hypothetical protein